MKECELCDSPARMYCESDQASLCWDCDAKVHCANFLVARHTRSLLCHACQSPTPWKASGSKLGPTISICERCVNRCNGREERDRDEEDEEENEGPDDDDEEEDDDEIDGEDETDDNDNNEDDDDGSGDEEDGENQVVPWSSTPTPPIASSSSSDESSSSRFCNGGGVGETSRTTLLSLKRMRDKLDLSSQDDLGCSTSQLNYNPAAAMGRTTDEEATSLISFRPLKDRKLSLTIQSAQTESKSSATLLGSLKRFEQKMLSGNNNVSESILAICKLSKDPRALSGSFGDN